MNLIRFLLRGTLLPVPTCSCLTWRFTSGLPLGISQLRFLVTGLHTYILFHYLPTCLTLRVFSCLYEPACLQAHKSHPFVKAFVCFIIETVFIYLYHPPSCWRPINLPSCSTVTRVWAFKTPEIVLNANMYSPDESSIWRRYRLVNFIPFSFRYITKYISLLLIFTRLVATIGSKSSTRRITRKAIQEVDVQRACGKILEPGAPIALRLQGNLLYGISRVHNEQCTYLAADAKKIRDQMQFFFKAFPGNQLELGAGVTT